MLVRPITAVTGLGQKIWNWLGLLVLLSLGLFSSGSWAANAADEQSGSLLLKFSQDAQPVEALRVSSSFRAQVTGNIARIHVTQQFENSIGRGYSFVHCAERQTCADSLGRK